MATQTVVSKAPKSVEFQRKFSPRAQELPGLRRMPLIGSNRQTVAGLAFPEALDSRERSTTRPLTPIIEVGLCNDPRDELPLSRSSTS
jgi:hypothetical protein